MGGIFLAQDSVDPSSKFQAHSSQPNWAQLDSLESAIDSLMSLGEYAQVVDHSLSVEHKLIPLQDSFHLSLFRQHRGNAMYELRDYTSAIEAFNSAIAASPQSEAGFKLKATQLFDRANAEYQLDLLADCYRSTLASEALLSELENPDYDYLISVYNDLAYQSRTLGFYDDARKFLNKAKSVYTSQQQLVDVMEIPVRKPVAFAYSEVLINAEAKEEEMMMAALADLEELVDQRTVRKAELVRLSSAYNAVADFYINNLKDYPTFGEEKAWKYIALTRQTLDPNLNPQGVDQINFNEAKLLFNSQKFEQAQKRFEQLADELDQSDLRRPFFEVMKAMCYMKLDEPVKAKDSFFEMMKRTHLGKDALKEDGSNYQPSTNIIHASLFAEIADSIRVYDESLYTSIGTTLVQAGIKEFEANYNGEYFSPKLKSTYELLLKNALRDLSRVGDEPIKRQKVSELLSQSETIESQFLWSQFLLNRRRGSLKVPDSVRRTEQLMRLNITEARRSGDVQRCFELEKELEKFEQSIHEQYPTYSSFAQGRFDLTAFQQKLDDQTLVVKYVELKNTLSRWEITSSDIRIDDLGSSTAVKAQSQKYLDVILNRKEDRTQAHELCQRLLPKNYESFSKIVVVNGAMFGLPFDALCDEQKNYLVESRTITYAPHLVFSGYDEVDSFDKGKIFVFCPTTQSDNTDLKGAIRESSFLSNSYRSDYYSDQRATREAFLSGSAKANVLHLSMHAEIDEELVERSCFLFHDQKLYLDELYGLDLSGQMAVLSACNTGKSLKDIKNGNASLQRAFMYAGIPSTLSSLWEVPDASSEKIIQTFYTQLYEGKTNGEAIRMAKKDFLSQVDDPHLRAPYFWAGFILSGKDQTIALHSNETSTSIWWIVLAGILLLGLLLFFVRSRQVSI